jgi:hypothetical protein
VDELESRAVKAAQIASVVLGVVAGLVLIGFLIGNDTLALIGAVALLLTGLIDGYLWWRARRAR